MIKRRFSMRWAGVVMVVLSALLVGCEFSIGTAEVGEVQSDSQTVELGAAEAVDVRVIMAAGQLVITGGAGSLMVGDFQYNVAEWAPRVDYGVDGSQGMLVVDQEGEDLAVSTELVNDWTLQLSNDVPIDLEVATGAGESNLNLTGMNLTGLEVDMGAGSVVIDLSSPFARDLTVTIDGGVGELTVMLPSEMGVQASVETGLGNLSTEGLEQDGDNYVNEAYGTAENTLFLEINAGVGEVELIVEE